MENAQEKWIALWNPEIHKTDDAKKRIKSAKAAKLTPVKIDTEGSCGFFSGSSGEYETYLNYCPCGDFHRRKQPCKHIYRLAIELGVMNESVETNINAIPTPRKKVIALQDTVDLIETLSETAQLTLLEIAAHIRSTTPTYEMKPDESISELIRSGIVTDTSPEKHKIKFGKKSEITELLDLEGITYEKNLKKSDLEQICYDKLYEKSKDRFTELIVLSIPTKYSSVKIHHYLHRKFDKEEYFDPATGHIKMISLLKTKLPDDDVTQQLIKSGYYTI